MPELPEVETIKRGLAKSIIGKKIVDFTCDTKKMINLPLPRYQKSIIGKTVKGIERRAKMIIIDLSEDWRVWFHLKMTGQLVYSGRKKKIVGGHPIKEGFEKDPNRFTHATFSFSDGTHLYFNDVRKFGWVKLYQKAELESKLDAMKLGPEPLTDDFSLAYLKEQIKRLPNRKIKVFLMDNQIVVGIGNIYSDEICFYARVRPDRKVKDLRENEIKLIFRGIKKILAEAIKYEGTSISDYVNAMGEAGSYTKKLKIYQRYGEKCFGCRHEVRRMKLGGRTSSYCPNCQK